MPLIVIAEYETEEQAELVLASIDKGFQYKNKIYTTDTEKIEYFKDTGAKKIIVKTDYKIAHITYGHSKFNKPLVLKEALKRLKGVKY